MQTINDKGYTKHYFEEGKRICSKIGSGGLIDIGGNMEGISQGIEEIRDLQKEGVVKTFDICMQIYPYINTNNLYKTIVQPYENPINPDEPIFYYHSDHLGSASFLTDRDGYETQQLVYLPFGEDWVDMKYNTGQYDTPYKFNGKEKDEETGYNNYGARYYYDWASIWLSVDPMSDKYPHVTSYNYCANNPIMLIDPDGEDPIYAKNFWGKVKTIGDDGRKGNGSYLVRGSVAKEVKAATKAGNFYTGSLSQSDNVMHIPTGQIQQDVQKTVKATVNSGTTSDTRVEHGGHALDGDVSARIWDKGTPMEISTNAQGQIIKKWSINPFVIGGKKNVGGPSNSIQFIWHVQPVNSQPSPDGDIKVLRENWRKGGFTGNPFIIGVENGRVNFYNEKGTIMSVKYKDFIRMGNQEQID